MKKALVVTYNKFPDGDAGAVRQLVFSKILKELDYAVHVIGMGNDTGSNSISGVEHTTFRNKKTDLFSKIDNFFGFNRKLKKYLKCHDGYDLVLVVDLPMAAMKQLEMYSKRVGATLIHDSVEWYSKEEFKLGVLSPEYLRKDIKNKYLFNKNWRIVAISSYLCDYFTHKGNHTIRIPVILDGSKFSFCKKTNEDKNVILYAGSPGGKDCFDQILTAIEKLDQGKRDKLEFRIIGVTCEWLKKSMNISDERWNKLSTCINCMGRVSREVVLENLNEADYTILVRKSELRYAKAGFSTKVPESLSTGTPVICNYSSDLNLYLFDGENSVIAENNTAQAIYDALNRALEFDENTKRKMQKKAFETAMENFDYRNYVKAFGEFLEEVN